MPHARTTDPATSHDAAESVMDVTRTQFIIRALLTSPATDEELVKRYLENQPHSNGVIPKASPSGIRSRRAELYKLGLVVPVGYSLTESGRKAIVWEAA